MSRRHNATASSTTNESTYNNPKLEKEISRCSSHSWIDLSDQKLTDQDTEIITKQAIIKKQCLNLNLRYNQITSVGASILAGALQNNTILRILYLSYNQISDMGVKYLVNALSTNTSLIELQLGHNGITDLGVRDLSEMLKTNRSLIHLGLPGNRIGNPGIELLSDSLTHYNTHLEVLNIQENELVTSESVEFLVNIIKHSQALKQLSVSQCHLSETAIKRLQQASNEKHSFVLGVC